MINIMVVPTLDGQKLTATAYGDGAWPQTHHELIELTVLHQYGKGDRQLLLDACEALLEALLAE